jgi:DNA-binding NarL/FixJ family response regulator
MAAPRSSTERPIRLLYADDHHAVRTALRTLLDRVEDIDLVGEAEDGDMALTMARALRPDLVMLDIDMPRMSGPEAAAAIKAQLPETRILYFTGDRRLTADASGSCDGIVYKTDPVSELLAWIRQVGRDMREPLSFASHARGTLPQLAAYSAPVTVSGDWDLTHAVGAERTPIRFRASLPDRYERPYATDPSGQQPHHPRNDTMSEQYASRDPDQWADGDPRRATRPATPAATSQGDDTNRRLGDAPRENRLQAIPLADGGVAIRDGSRLTPRQVGVLKYVAAGYTNRRTAEELGISPDTVKKHVHALLRFTGSTNRAALASWWTEVKLGSGQTDDF